MALKRGIELLPRFDSVGFLLSHDGIGARLTTLLLDNDLLPLGNCSNQIGGAR